MKINTKMIVGYYLYTFFFFLKRNTKASKDSLGLQTKCKQDHNNTSTFTDIGHRQERKTKSLIGLVPYWAIAQP